MSGEEKAKFIMGVTRLYEKLPLDRIGVLLGENGRVKRKSKRKHEQL